MAILNQPLVSIVIPVYNGANYLGQAIESALGQTYEPKEVIVVDDGSSDNGATRAVAESFGNRIRYIQKVNGGVATALNTGVSSAHGQLVSWLSHDDFYRPEKVARQVAAWERFGARCIVIGDFEMRNAAGEHMQTVSLTGHSLVARPLDAVFRGLINGCALLVPKELFQTVGLFEPGLPTTQDYYLWYCMARVVPFVHCPYADCCQRIHPLQGSRQMAHLDEAGRMFSHLIDVTPKRLMEAYDGSELRFLLNVRRNLAVYAGLYSYLTFRIQQLMRSVRYAVVWVHDQGEAGLHTDLPVGLWCAPVSVQSIFSANPREIFAAAQLSSGDCVLFLRAPSRLAAAQVEFALETFLREDADVACTDDGGASSVDGLVVRHDALTFLADAVGKIDLHSEELKADLRWAFYDAADTKTDDTESDLCRALRGEAALDYRPGISSRQIASLIVAQHHSSLPTILFLQHGLGGGAHVHLNLLIQSLSGRANSVIIYGYPDGMVRLSAVPALPGMGLSYSIAEHLQELVDVLQRIQVSQVDVHHTLSFEMQAEALVEALSMPFDVTLVDYHFVATNPFLGGQDWEFVGDAQLLTSQILRKDPLPLFKKARRAIAISRDVAERFGRIDHNREVIPARLWHDGPRQVRHVFAPRLWGNEPLRVLVMGEIVPHKGREIVLDVARIIAERQLPIRIHILGNIQLSASTRREIGEALTISGQYSNDTFASVLGSLAPHTGWLPARVPETWSYVLTKLMDAGLPIAATAIGAIPERCTGRPFTWLLPLSATAVDWVDLFLELHASQMEKNPQWAGIDHLPPAQDFYFERYLNPPRPQPL